MRREFLRGRHWEAGGAPFRASTLAAAAPMSRVRIVSLPLDRRVSARLLSLGITPGRVLVVVDNRPEYPWSPVIVEVGGVEVAIGRGLAARINVEVAGENGAVGRHD